MRVSLPLPRLLPVTMLAMAAVLAVKTAGLLQLAVPARAASSNAAAAPPAAVPAAAMPVAAMPVAAMPVAAMPVAAMPIAAPPAPDPAPSASELALLQGLRRRSAELDARAAALAAREELAAAADKRLSARLDQLTALQQRLEALEAARRQRDEASWQGLVRMYEAMKPRDAATIFDGLDMPVLLQVVDRMNDRRAALVLAAMQPDRARDLTAQLAELRTAANRVAAAAPAPH